MNNGTMEIIRSEMNYSKCEKTKVSTKCQLHSIITSFKNKKFKAFLEKLKQILLLEDMVCKK